MTMISHRRSQPRSLSNQVVAITGGARGIGEATAAALVCRGCRVAIGDLDIGVAEKTAERLGGGTLALPLDVTDRDSFTALSTRPSASSARSTSSSTMPGSCR